MYNPSIPNDLPAPANIVSAMKINFSQYADIFDNNHLALNLTGQGKHSNVILQQQSTDPNVEDGFDSIYGKSVVTTSVTANQAFVKLPQFLTNGQPNSPMQLTFNSVNTSGPQYQSFLIGGYLIYFGTIASAANINVQITLSPTPSEIVCVIPNPTKVAAVGINPSAPIKVSVTVNNSSQFTINAVFPGIGGTGDINWLAIAKQ